jgi:acyl carrier protein
MAESNIKKAVLETITEIQRLSGRQIPDQLDDDDCPIGSVAGFDSINAVEATVSLSAKLNCEIDFNPFISERGTRALKLKQVVSRLNKLLTPKET